MTRRTTTRSSLALSFFVLLGLSGCWGNEVTEFPAGLTPWEPVNMAMPPAAQPGNQFPEELTYAELFFRDPTTSVRSNSVHSQGFIQAPIATVWAAARNPQTGRDPEDSQGWAIRAWNTDPMYAFSYRTYVLVEVPVRLEWELEWRHGIVQGTVDAPTITASRWQKVSGTTAIPVLEGSMILRAVDGQPNVTLVQYQYHLKAPLSDHSPMKSFLRVAFQRLRDVSHGRMLMPNDCMNCPPAPAGY